MRGQEAEWTEAYPGVDIVIAPHEGSGVAVSSDAVMGLAVIAPHEGSGDC